jgi:hypothetical protein
VCQHVNLSTTVDGVSECGAFNKSLAIDSPLSDTSRIDVGWVAVPPILKAQEDQRGEVRTDEVSPPHHSPFAHLRDGNVAIPEGVLLRSIDGQGRYVSGCSRFVVVRRSEPVKTNTEGFNRVSRN